jgi:hypothetical protein
MFNKQQLAVVRFCAEECVRQHTGPEAVAWMVNAYQYAASTLQQLRAQGAQLEEEHILTLVTMIEPEVNCNGFRTTLVRFADGTVLRVQDHATPEQFYQEYEEIHPCDDGNGRAGAILFNLLRGTLDNPVVPPPFKKGRTSYESSFGEVQS